jgi:hypothetical protein
LSRSQEERDAGTHFERIDLPTQRGAGDAERIGRPSETSF